MKSAFRQIALSRAPFVSRGDRSGTHLKELQVWNALGISPEGEWYIVSSGIVGNMGVLRLAQEKQAYTLVDRATYLLSNRQHKMRIHRQRGCTSRELENVFSRFLVIRAVQL